MRNPVWRNSRLVDEWMEISKLSNTQRPGTWHRNRKFFCEFITFLALIPSLAIGNGNGSPGSPYISYIYLWTWAYNCVFCRPNPHFTSTRIIYNIFSRSPCLCRLFATGVRPLKMTGRTWILRIWVVWTMPNNASILFWAKRKKKSPNSIDNIAFYTIFPVS